MAKKTKWLIAGVVVVAAAWYFLSGPADPGVRLAPLVARLSAARSETPRVVTAKDLLEWGRSATPVAVIKTATDELPNGLALTMFPYIVDWDGSDLTSNDPIVLVRNVSVGGNPIQGENILATVSVPLNGLEELQWCLTQTRNAGNKDTFMGHSQLRFLFHPDQHPVVLNEDGETQRFIPDLDDIVLSWEAWRPPLAQYDPLGGLDPETYALTARAYSGVQRFLIDALSNNPWVCYPVVLPETEEAVRDVFLTGLLMGDALARRMVAAMVDDGDLVVPDIDELTDFSEDDLDQVRAIFSNSRLPDDPLADLMGEADLSYHLLLRSCITQSLAAIQLGLIRTHDRHDLGPPPRMNIVPGNLPGWIDDLATASRSTLITRLPGALLYVARNQQILPSAAFRVLDEAGLLFQEDGAPVSYYYHVESTTPYGELRDNLM